MVFLTVIKSMGGEGFERKIMSSCLCFVPGKQCGWWVRACGFVGLGRGGGGLKGGGKGGGRGLCTVGEWRSKYPKS